MHIYYKLKLISGSTFHRKVTRKQSLVSLGMPAATIIQQVIGTQFPVSDRNSLYFRRTSMWKERNKNLCFSRKIASSDSQVFFQMEQDIPCIYIFHFDLFCFLSSPSIINKNYFYFRNLLFCDTKLASESFNLNF